MASPILISGIEKVSPTERPFSMLVTLIRGAVTSIRRATGRSNYRKWRDSTNLSKDWDQRTQHLAALVPSGSSVIEFGAGRLVLRGLLPDGCTYTPSDIVDRGHGTIVCDLNAKDLPDFASYDVAVFSGVLEYVNDVPRLVRHLSNRVNVILTSYAATDHSTHRNRRALGWVNDFESGQLLRIFEDAGFECTHTDEWNSQVIYRLQNRGTIAQKG